MTQLPAAVSADILVSTDSASDVMSASEAGLLQQVGWEPGRRGLDVRNTGTDQHPAATSSRTALKHFWQHFASMPWLLGYQSHTSLKQQSPQQQAQRQDTEEQRPPHDDFVYTDPKILMSEPAAETSARLVVKASNADESTHFKLIKRPAHDGMPASVAVLPGDSQRVTGLVPCRTNMAQSDFTSCVHGCCYINSSCWMAV